MSSSTYVPHAIFVEKAELFGRIHARKPTNSFVQNIDAEIAVLSAGELSFPVTINDSIHPNAWVCSPLTTYSSYALEETRRVAPRLLAAPLGGVIQIADAWLRRSHIDKAVSINNWLVSTNLYPDVRGIDLAVITQECAARWPTQGIWFRSLNVYQHADWLRALANVGFQLVPTRQVYVFHDVKCLMAVHQNLRRDVRLLHTTPLQFVPNDAFADLDFETIETLYAKLYIEKYSSLNPRYTALFMKTWHTSGLLEFGGFRDAKGVLVAVVGMFAQGDLVTAPIVGYDTARPRSDGLYRLLMAHVLQWTIERNATLNLSAGAAHFKRLRGGEPTIEYSAVFSGHLPASARRALSVLSALTTRIGIPVMERFQL